MLKLLDRWPKLKAFFNDSLWSLLALLLMNVTAQFIVYPFFSRKLGTEGYGDVLYLLSLVNIVAVSVGAGANNARMKASVKGETHNGDYNLFFVAAGLCSVPFAVLVSIFGGVAMTPPETLLYWCLTCATFLRYYSDVAFRLALDYKGYFFYYLAVSLGYLAGVALFMVTGLWPLALLPGELAGILFAAVRTDLYQKRPFRLSPDWKTPIIAVLLLVFSQLITNLVFNADRMLLKHLVGGTAVTVYYLASLMGKTVSLITTPLNSVIIGHLSKYKGTMTRKLVGIILLALLGCTVAGTLVCSGVSHIFVALVYPQEYELVKPFFLISNGAQILFFAGSIFSTILLRFTKESFQVVINIVYAVAFFACGIPITMGWGIWGFSYALLAATALRFLAAVAVALACAEKEEG